MIRSFKSNFFSTASSADEAKPAETGVINNGNALSMFGLYKEVVAKLPLKSMINQRSIEAVASASFNKDFCRPLYSSYCFSRIPATIKSLFGNGKETSRLPLETTCGEEYQHVVLFFLDGFGWKFFEHYLERSPLLQRIVKEGVASKLTSLFPSTTAAHVTCMNTGQVAGESGVYEWFYYEPTVDRIICPLTFSYAGDKKLGTLEEAGIKGTDLFPMPTFYQDLEKMGVSAFAFLQEDIVESPYSVTLLKGAERVPYHRLSDGLTKLREMQLTHVDKKGYFYFYFANIDSVGHHQGIESPQFESEIEKCLKTLEEEFYQKRGESRTALVIIADHGLVTIHPKETIYLNRELPEMVNWCQKNRQGDLLAPAGSCRDLFLHIKEENLQEAKEACLGVLKGQAAVYATDELVKEGFFGEREVSKRFLERVGNLVILPYGTENVWWYEKSRPLVHSHAMHGGLTRPEMEIPFLFLEL